MLPLSHDEVVHGKGSLLDQMPGDLWQKFANLRLLYGYMWTHPGKKLLFMGCEFGQWNEWNYDESLQWHLLQWETPPGLARRCVADVNHLMRREPALHEVDFDYTGFEWIDCHNWQNSVLVFMRKAKNPADFVDRRLQLHAGAARQATCWACRNAAGTKKSSTATRPTTAAATWATARASWPPTTWPTAGRSRLKSPCRHWRWWC